MVRISVTDGAGDFADSLPGILEQLLGLGQPEFLEIVVEGHADRGGEKVGNISGVQVQGRRQVGQLHGLGVMFTDVIQHYLDEVLAVVAVVQSFAGAPRSVSGSPRCEGGFQVVDDKPCQANRVQEGSLVRMGSWGRLLHEERQQAEVRDFEAGAVVDGAAKAAKALLGFLASPRGLPPFPQAGLACRRELARRALACSRTGRREIARLQFSRPLVPPDMKMQPGQLMEQVPQRSGEPLLKKVLTLSEGENSRRIVCWTGLVREPRGCCGRKDTSGQVRSSVGNGFRCARSHVTEASPLARLVRPVFASGNRLTRNYPYRSAERRKLIVGPASMGKPTPPRANVKPNNATVHK